MAKLFENLNIMKSFVRSAAANKLAEADTLNTAFAAIGQLPGDIAALAQEAQYQNKQLDMQQAKIDTEKTNNQRLFDLEEDKIKYEGLKENANNSITSPGYVDSDLSFLIDEDIFTTDVYKKVAADKNQQLQKDSQYIKSYGESMTEYRAMEQNDGESNLDFFGRKIDAIGQMENNLSLNTNTDSAYYKKQVKVLEEEGTEVLNDLVVEGYADFIDKNYEGMGLKKSDTDTFVKSLRQATNPEQVKSMISTFMGNVQMQKGYQIQDAQAIAGLANLLSDPDFVAFANPQVVNNLQNIVFQTSTAINQSIGGNAQISNSDRVSTLRAQFAVAPKILTAPGLPNNQKKVTVQNNKGEIEDAILAYELVDNVPKYYVMSTDDSTIEEISEEQALYLFEQES
jgi:hypothetical protein